MESGTRARGTLKIAAESRADVEDVVGLAHVLFDQVAFELVVEFSDRVHASSGAARYGDITVFSWVQSRV